MIRLLLCAALLSACDHEATSDPEVFRSYAAEPAQECQWPGVGVLDDDRLDPCSAVLIHPSVVLTTAGCVGSVLDGEQHRLWLGEVASSPRVSATIEQCTPHPDAAGTLDNLAVCTLVEPVADVPIAPVLHPSEAVELELGTSLRVVGFGAERIAYDGEFFGMPTGMGRKRIGIHEIEAFDEPNNTMTLQSTDGSTACYGDFGGPAMLQLADGSWRVAAIMAWLTGGGVPTDNACLAELTFFARLSNRIDWIEEVAGVDITPCHDDAGDPADSEECDAVPTHIAAPGAMWDDGCAAPPPGDESSGSEAGTTGAPDPDPEPSGTSSTTMGTPDPPTPSTSSESGADETGDASSTEPESGCGCRGTPGSPGGLWLLVLIVARRRWAARGLPGSWVFNRVCPRGLTRGRSRR